MPSQSSQNNKRITKNTLFLYFRMLLLMCVNLFTSRVVLETLGINDYGIYNVVGGVVTMFSFLNSCMTTSTQRFLNFELGKGNIQKLKDVFAASLNIHILIALCIVLLSDTIGLWFINAKLVIPSDRLVAANWVYQFSILTFCINIIQVPYNAVLIAHEKMDIYAYISIVEAFLKLGVVYILGIIVADKLMVYGILLFLIQLLIRSIYQVYCRKHYAESVFRLYWNKQLYREMSTFAGLNLFGSIAWLLRDQGVNIILNSFFGPVINAARGIALQVSNAVMGFISNFQIALNPQITKHYAKNELHEMESLSYTGIKFSFILLFCLSFPICLNINYILNLWLVEVPDYTAIFVVLIMVDALVGGLFGTPYMTSLSATGRIRNYQMVVSCIILCIVPVGYAILKMGYDVTSVFYITILFSFISGFVRFLFCRKLIGFSLRKMAKEVMLPVTALVIFSLPLPIALKQIFFIEKDMTGFIGLCIITFCISAVVSWYIAITPKERLAIIKIVRSKI